MTEADANSTPTWLSRREAVDRVACHLGYPTENAWLRIIRYGRAGRIKARGRVAEGWAISLLSDAWREGPGEVTNLELLLDDLIEADLLPAPGRPEGPEELTWWLEGRAHAYVIEGFPIEWGDWTPEMIQQRERAEILLGEAIRADLVQARGRQTPHGPEEDVPGGDFSPERVERKSLARPKVILDVFGDLAILPRHLLQNYKGPHWCSIKVDSAAVKSAFPRPLIARIEPEPAPAPPAEPPPEPKQPAPKKAAKRRRRPGPRSGTIDRFAEADRALFPKMTELIKQRHITEGEAARILSDKIEGRGDGDSKIRRLAKRYREEVNK